MRKILIITSVLILLGAGTYFFFSFEKTNWNIKYEVTPVVETGSAYEQQKTKIAEENQKNNELYNVAIRDQDATLCEGIKDADKKNECHDMIVVNTAKQKGDIASCETLSTEGNKTICRDIINGDTAIKEQKKELCEKISDINKKIYCKGQVDSVILSAAIKNQTVSQELCGTLEVKYQKSCLTEIHELDESTLYTEAINQNDASLCKKITNTELQSTCIDTIHLKLAISTQNSLLCEEMQNTEKKAYCLTQLSKTVDIDLYKSAQNSGDLETCTRISNDNLRVKCHDTIIITSVKNTKDPSLCDTLTNTGIIASCKQIGQ